MPNLKQLKSLNMHKQGTSSFACGRNSAGNGRKMVNGFWTDNFRLQAVEERVWESDLWKAR